MQNNLRVLDAYKRAEAAAKDLERTVYQEYPIGCTVLVKHGASSSEYEVTAHSHCWWSAPGRMSVTNPRTGKTRHIEFTHIFADHDWIV